MKKLKVMIVLGILSAFLVACGDQGERADEAEEGNDDAETEDVSWEYEPEPINPETDVCEICAMAVADDQHATQIVLKNERSLKFDDLGCLYKWMEENGEDEIGGKFVRDFHTEDWVLIEDATYVFDEMIETPMAYGIISFADEADAENYIEENGLGELLTAADLDSHKWQMMKHDHDVHDEEHDNDDA